MFYLKGLCGLVYLSTTISETSEKGRFRGPSCLRAIIDPLAIIDPYAIIDLCATIDFYEIVVRKNTFEINDISY